MYLSVSTHTKGGTYGSSTTTCRVCLLLIKIARSSLDFVDTLFFCVLISNESGNPNRYHVEALQIFGQVGLGKLRPNSVTVASLLSSCGSLADGLQIHCWAVKLGVETEVYVGTSLLTVYSNWAEMVSATKVFDMISNRNVVSYNAYITGLLQNGVFSVVLDVFKEMMGCSTEIPNPVTLVSVVSACSSLLFLQFGRQVHGLARKTDMAFDTMVGTAFVDMYSKCSQWKCAYDLFQELNGNRNLITWNSLIAGMMLNGQIEYAIKFFMWLESEGLKPDSATWNSMINGFTRLGKEGEALMFFRKMQSAGVRASLKSITSLLPACSALFALRCGKEIHGHAIRTGICKDEFIGTALIDMYMKCGLSPLAQRTFDLFDTNTNDPAIWNAMISGYGKNGQFESGFEIFNQMVEEKVKPNLVTFNCILSMCSHTGKVERGWEVFRMMSRDYGLIPASDHINRIVDLLGRSGWLDEAREVLHEIPVPSASVIASLLNASICHSDFKLGEEMAIMLSELEPENPAPIVVLSNIYAGQGRWKDAERVRKTIDDRRLKKFPGLSLIGVA